MKFCGVKAETLCQYRYCALARRVLRLCCEVNTQLQMDSIIALDHAYIDSSTDQQKTFNLRSKTNNELFLSLFRLSPAGTWNFSSLFIPQHLMLQDHRDTVASV